MFPSQALAHGIIDSLIAGGVRDFVYCPGSRNAPFAYALARLEAQAESSIRVHVRLDERSAAFFALGLNLDASASQRRGHARACVITTSGSAVAELYPAIVEARYSRVPLLAISADRPVDLHGVGASQTMTQQGLFSPHIVGEWNFSTAAEEIGNIPDRICRALAASAGLPSGTPGPVHINCEFRDPLIPEESQSESACEAVEGKRRAGYRSIPRISFAIPSVRTFLNQGERPSSLRDRELGKQCLSGPLARGFRFSPSQW